MTSTQRTTAAGIAGIEALLHRDAGYAVAAKCLEEQAAAESRDPSLRTERTVRLAPEARSWLLGALGEIHVGRLLTALGPEWFVRHSVPIGSGTTDVDHLLIGPPGVFALNSKFHRGADIWVGDRVLMVRGSKTTYLAASRNEAANVSRRLSGACGSRIPVQPVLVIVGASRITDRRADASRAVAVIHDRDLVRWLRSLPPVWSPSECHRVRLEAEDPALWHVDEHAVDRSRVMPRFERFCHDVGVGLQRPAEGVPDAPSRPTPAPIGRPHRRRVVLTAILAAVALAILVPVVAIVAGLLASGQLPWFWLVVAPLAVLGLLGGTAPRSRRRRWR